MVDVFQFSGKYSFLSNFWPVEVVGPGNLTYPSVEHAYQASKTFDMEAWSKICYTPEPGKVKRMGRKLDMRPDWDEIKLAVMEELLRQKFTEGSPFATLLLEIDGDIQEGNSWGDQFWGVDIGTGSGKNHLGRILMKLRDELVELDKPPWED